MKLFLLAIFIIFIAILCAYIAPTICNIRKYIKYFLICIIVIIAIISFLSYKFIYVQYYSTTTQEAYFYTELNKELEQGKTKIKLTNLTNFEWDYFILLGSYGGTISKGKINIGDDEYLYDGNIDINLGNDAYYTWCILFTKGDKVVEMIRGRRGKLISPYYGKIPCGKILDKHTELLFTKRGEWNNFQLTEN